MASVAALSCNTADCTCAGATEVASSRENGFGRGTNKSQQDQSFAASADNDKDGSQYYY